jgi:hypothetical protein
MELATRLGLTSVRKLNNDNFASLFCTRCFCAIPFRSMYSGS